MWLSNALGAFAIEENLYVCWRVRLLRAQDDRWGMFGKRRNSLISDSLGPTAETVTHHPCFSPQIRHMYPINSYQPCMRKSSTVIEKSQDDFSWNGKQLNTYEGYKKKSSKREFTWTTTDVHRQSHYWNHFWKPHASFKAVSFRGRALGLVSSAQRFCGIMSETRAGRVVDLLNDLFRNPKGQDDDLKYSSVQGRRGTTDLTQMPDSEPLYPFARFTESKALFQNKACMI